VIRSPALAGCGAPVVAPSLMPRAVEKQPIDMPLSEPVEAQTPADSALKLRIAAQIKAAEAGEAAFNDLRKEAEAAVAAAIGQPQGSESWIQAQEAITALESPRGIVRDAAAAIDGLRAEPGSASAGNRAAIDAASAEVQAMELRQREAVAALVAKLG